MNRIRKYAALCTLLGADAMACSSGTETPATDAGLAKESDAARAADADAGNSSCPDASSGACAAQEAGSACLACGASVAQSCASTPSPGAACSATTKCCDPNSEQWHCDCGGSSCVWNKYCQP